MILDGSLDLESQRKERKLPLALQLGSTENGARKPLRRLVAWLEQNGCESALYDSYMSYPISLVLSAHGAASERGPGVSSRWEILEHLFDRILENEGLRPGKTGPGFSQSFRECHTGWSSSFGSADQFRGPRRLQPHIDLVIMMLPCTGSTCPRPLPPFTLLFFAGQHIPSGSLRNEGGVWRAKWRSTQVPRRDDDRDHVDRSVRGGLR